MGVSKPAYSKDELERFKENDKKTFEFEGKTYTGYEGTQLQRKIETSIRHYRDLSKMANAGGDEELKLKADKKIRQLTNKYHQLSKESGLPTRMERLQSAVKWIDKTDNSGIINTKVREIIHINNIDSSIEQRNTAKGNPNAILQFDRPLNNRQQMILDNLRSYDSRITVRKNQVNMSDLSAITAITGDEFAMFTKGKERTIVRGNTNSVNIDVEKANELRKQGYKWSGHTHPGTNKNCLNSSPGDVLVLKAFGQKRSVIYNSKGQFQVFEGEY